MDFFQDNTEMLREIRKQILTYNSTINMNDRERAVFLGLPEGCRIREHAKIFNIENFKCGKNVWIGEGAMLDAQGGLSIGDYSQIGLYVMIWSHSSHEQAFWSETIISKDLITYKPTSIGSSCFIAGPSVIAPGVKIGNRVVISPCSFVDRDLPDGTHFSNTKALAKIEKRLKMLEDEIEKRKKDIPSSL